MSTKIVARWTALFFALVLAFLAGVYTVDFRNGHARIDVVGDGVYVVHFPGGYTFTADTK